MARSIPPLNPLHVFEVASRVGSFTKAAELLSVAMRELSPEDRQVITLLELEGRSVKDICQLTGFSNAADGLIHAVVWKATGLSALPTPPGTIFSEASAINNVNQVAGAVIDASGPRLFLWDHGIPIDVSALLPSGSGWTGADTHWGD